MKKIILLISIAFSGFALAGGVEGGGPKGMTTDDPIQVEIPDLGPGFPSTLVDPVTGTPVLNPKLTEGLVSHADLLRVIEASLDSKEVSLDLGKAGIVNFIPQKLDLPNKSWKGCSKPERK